MTIVLLAELVSTSVRLALSLKVIFIQLILNSVQTVVLVQMYVLLKQFTQLNNTIPQNKIKAAFLMEKRPLLIFTPTQVLKPDTLKNKEGCIFSLMTPFFSI